MTHLLRSGAVRRLAALALFVALAAGMFIQPAQAQTTYVITDGSTVLVHTSSSTDPTSVLLEAGISLGQSDTITLSDSGERTEIIIQRAQLVSISCAGELMMVGSYGETVADILSRQGISLSPLDRLNCRLTDETYDGMVIRVTRVRVETEESSEVIPFQTITCEDASLEADEQIVLREGSNGAVRTTCQVRYEDGEETERTVISQEVIAEAVDALVLQSPDRETDDHNLHLTASDAIQPERVQTVSGGSSSFAQSTFNGTTVTTASGEVLTVTRVLDCEATAYTCPGYVGTTATGTTARVGAIAVDPRFIPLGSKLYVVTNDGAYIYGYCTAEDTGGAIKGNIIDLYFNTWDECIQFGRRACTVYVLG